MRSSVWLGALSIALAGAASAQKSDGVVQVEATPVTISGDVIRYEPGRAIVIRDKDGRDVAYYAITSESSVPEHLVTGKNITFVVPNPRARVVRTITVSQP